MNISEIFSSKERIRILKRIIYLEDSFGVSEVARVLHLSKGLISKYFNLLSERNILRSYKRRFYIQDNLFVKSIKIMFNLNKINPKIFKKYKFVASAGLYGSCVKGTNTEKSDVDLWVKVIKASEEDKINLMTELRNEIKSLKVLILDQAKIDLLKKQDPLFYHSLYFSSIIVYGNEI